MFIVKVFLLESKSKMLMLCSERCVRTSAHWLKCCQASPESGCAGVRITVIEITVSFAAVLHAQLIRVAGATASRIKAVSDFRVDVYLFIDIPLHN